MKNRIPPCGTCGLRHDKAALAFALGVDINTKVGALTKVLRWLKAEELDEVWRRIDNGATPQEAVSTPVLAAASQAPKGSMLDDVMRTIAQDVVSEALADYSPDAAPLDESRVLELIAQRAPDSMDDGRVASIVRDELERLAPRRLEVRTEFSTVQIDGVQHEALEPLVKLLAVEPNVLLVGPAGPGKTTMAVQATKLLGLEPIVYPCSEESPAWHITGRQRMDNGTMVFDPASGFIPGIESDTGFIFYEWDKVDILLYFYNKYLLRWILFFIVMRH